MKSPNEEMIYCVANMTTDKLVACQVSPFDADTDATTRSMPDMDHITDSLQREIHCTTSSKQKWLKMELWIHMIRFEARWETFDIPIL